MKLPRVVFAFILSVLGLASQLRAAPTIDTQPTDKTVVIGNNTSFSITATTSGGALTFQWEGLLAGGSTWGPLGNAAPFGGVTTNSLTVSAPAYVFNGAKARCMVTDANGTTTTSEAILTINSPAPALILANPTSKSAFEGDGVATDFAVLASGTGLTYQWQLSTNNFAAAPTNLTDTGVYSGTATATLHIADPYTNFSGATYNNSSPFKYRCVVMSTTDSYVINSRPAALIIYASPSNTAVVTTMVNGSLASTIISNDPSAITVVVSGVPASPNGTVRIGRYADLNGNNQIDPGEPLVQGAAVTDGLATAFGGITDPDIPGDADLTADGTINANFYIAKSAELGRGSGNYIFRVASTTGAFRTVDSSVFTVTQPTLAHTVSGTVTDGTNPIPYAQVALLVNSTNGGNVVNETVANISGGFTLQADPGSYQVLALAPGYVTSFNTSPPADTTSGNVSGLTISLTPAAYMNTVMLVDQGNPVRSVQVFFQSDSTGNIAIGNTDNNGVATGGAVAVADWSLDISSQSLAGLGYVRPQSNNGIALNTTNYTFPLQAANAMIYGTLTDNAANPLPNVNVNAGEQSNTYSADTLTDATGHYYLPIYTTGASNWNVQVDNQDPIWASSHVPAYIMPAGQPINSVAGGSANLANFVANVATAHLSGLATKLGVAQPDLRLDLYSVNLGNGNKSYAGSTTTDASGNFSFGVTAGTWAFALSTNTNNGTPVNPTNIVGPGLQYTVNDGDNTTGIAYLILDSTGTINGTVTDFNGVGVSYANIDASATIGPDFYHAGAQTDGSGNYSFPSIAGTWTVNAFSNLSFPQAVVTAVPGPNTQNFSPSVFFYMPNDQPSVTAGSGTNFNAGVNYSGGITGVGLQWEVSTDGGTIWGNVPASGPYGGVTTNSLNISPATTGLSGNQYRLAVSFDYNSQAHTQYSTAATLTVTGTAPDITVQPISDNITASGGMSFTVGASGTPTPSYQWQYSTDGGANFYGLSDAVTGNGTFAGTQTTTLNVSNASTLLNGYQFKCVVSNGVGSDAVSSIVTLTVNAASQAVTFNGQTLTKDVPATLGATATSGLSTFNYSVQSSTTTSTLVGDQLTITGVGSVTVRATQPGNEYYSSAFQDATFTVNKLSGSVTLGNLSATYDGSPKSATATTTPVGGLTVNFTYTPPGDATAPTNAGSYTVVGTINDSTYQGSASDVLVIAKAGQTISFTGPVDQAYSATPLTLSASGGGSGNPVTFSLDSGPANLSGTNNSTLTLTGPGTVTVRALQAGNANYNAASDVVHSFVVSAAATGFAAWRDAKFTIGELADLNISGPNAIYGQDGLPNLVKYALGLEPKQNITTGLPVVTTTATDWVYTYQRPDSGAGITDVNYTVEYSTDLTTWTPLTDTFVSNVGGFDTRKATYALATATKIYFRLTITQP
ncbi:MAG: MBG domain-containing protein [Lacunisphaera sp.]|nr:MBG domain-containing protein [Lacunisphaera sp.]